MQYEQRYRIIKTDGSVIEGTYIQTKGNDEDYPTFVLADGSLLGVHRDAVLGPVVDDCPVDGIERPAFADNHIYGTQEGGVIEFVPEVGTTNGE
jgi:hypothetical protein